MSNCDIVNSVYNLISTHSENRANLWLNDFQQCGVLDHYECPRLAINHYWRLQLAEVKEETFLAYTALDDDMSNRQWLSAFKSQIMPFVIRYGLPQPLLGEGG